MTQAARPGGGNNFTGAEFTPAQAGGFAVSHWISPGLPASRRHGHGHAHAHFVLVTGGRYMTPLAEPGRPPLIYSPPQTWHADHVGEGGGSFLTITLPDRVVDSLPRRRLPGQATLLSDPAAVGLALALRRCAAAGADPDVLEALCLELSGALAAGRPERWRPAWLGRAVELLNEPACDSMEMSDIAAQVGVHPVHLARGFRRFAGCTPSEMRTGRRLKAAAGLLAHDRLSLAEVALEAGFADQSHFTRVFRSRFGVAPGRYREIVGGAVRRPA